MKILAIILILSLGLLGLNRFMVALKWMQPQTELSCFMDCCTGTEGSCCGDQEQNDDRETEAGADNENQCEGNCDCAYSNQIVAIGTPIQSPLDLSPLVFYHGVYHDNYCGDYLPPLFQPPRMA